jgi:hypothetical protein
MKVSLITDIAAHQWNLKKKEGKGATCAFFKRQIDA